MLQFNLMFLYRWGCKATNSASPPTGVDSTDSIILLWFKRSYKTFFFITASLFYAFYQPHMFTQCTDSVVTIWMNLICSLRGLNIYILSNASHTQFPFIELTTQQNVHSVPQRSDCSPTPALAHWSWVRLEQCTQFSKSRSNVPLHLDPLSFGNKQTD